MPPKQGARGGGGGGADRLSGLKNETLLRVMSHLKAWEAVRTGVLSRRWRNLWTLATRLDIRHPCGCSERASDDHPESEYFAVFVRDLLAQRAPQAHLDSLRLCWSHGTDYGDADSWIAYAVRCGAEEIELSGEHHGYPSPDYMSFIASRKNNIAKTRLKILKLIHVRLVDTALTKICSGCTCLEELELTDCVIPQNTKIEPILLERLTVIRCQIIKTLSVYAPKLVELQFSGNSGRILSMNNFRLLEAPGSCYLKIVKFSHVKLDDTMLAPLCSKWTSLEKLELNDCSVEGKKIGSTSLKYLTMISCKFAIGFRVHAPNLVLLRCIKPFQHFPLIEKMEFLVRATIVLEDSCLFSYCPWLHNVDNSDVNCIDESDHGSGDNKHSESDNSSTSNYFDSDRSEPSDEDEDDDDRTVEYSEISMEHIHKKYQYLINGHKRSAGVGMLLSLSNVKRMDLLAHPGEVLLTRELKSCTDFKNLKTLSLGEWCITPGFDVLAAMLGHSPNLENLFLHLDMAYNSRVGFDQWLSSFMCTKLKMVNITCCKHDVMLHLLADFFSKNSIPNDKIFVRRTACSGCTGGTSSQAKRKAQSEDKKGKAKQTKTGN